MKYKIRIFLFYSLVLALSTVFMNMLGLIPYSLFIFFITSKTFGFGFYFILIGIGLVVLDGVFIALVSDFPLRMKNLIKVRLGHSKTVFINEAVFIIAILTIKDIILLVFSNQAILLNVLFSNMLINVFLIYIYQKRLEGKYLLHIGLAVILRAIANTLFIS